MRREVNTEHRDKAFRDKILNQEHGPVRAGETVPPAFDWSAMPAPKLKISVARMVWTSLLVLTAIIAATLIFMPEATHQPNNPTKDTESAPQQETKPAVATDKSQFMADNAHKIENGEKGEDSNSNDAAFGMTGANSSNHTGVGESTGRRNETVSEKGMNGEDVDDGRLIADNGSGKESNGSIRTSSVNKNGESGKDNDDANRAAVTDVQIANENEMSNRSADAGYQVDNVTDATNEPNATNEANGTLGRSIAESDSDQLDMGVAAVPLVSGVGMTSSITSIDAHTQSGPEVTITAARLAPRDRFELRVFSSVNQGYRMLSGNGNNEDVVDRINMNESASANLGIGVHFGWKINRRWTLLTGISKRTSTTNYRFSEQVIYDKAREIVNSSGDFENSEEFVFETSGGHSTAKTRYAWRLLQDGLRHGDRLDFAFEFAREYHSVVIPLQVQYNIVNKAFKFGVIAGGQYARIHKTEVHSNRPEARIRPEQLPVPPRGRDFFTKNTFDVLLADRGLNKNVFEASLGLYLGYQFTELLGIYLQPSYSHGLNNIYASDNFSTIPTNKQIDAGIVLTF